MAARPPATLISCDEAGFTGPALLDPAQPYFVYASHDLSVAESKTLIGDIRVKFRIQAAELKSQGLKRRNDWAAICEMVTARCAGRVIVSASDKKVALAGKVFEYLFEPVLEKNNALFYTIDFHRFIMNAVHEVLSKADSPYSELATQMQQFMRSFDPEAAPSLFGSAGGRHPVMMERILSFCRGYAEIIAERTSHLRPGNSTTGKWALDLTTTSLFSLILTGWGHRHDRLTVLCDESKPLKESSDILDGFINRQGEEKLEAGRRQVAIRANLTGPVQFGSSLTHPTLQVADLLAGITAFALSNEVKPAIQSWVTDHMHGDYIMADPSLSSRASPTGKLGRSVLKELARRAAAGEDPLADMPRFVAGEVIRVRRKLRR